MVLTVNFIAYRAAFKRFIFGALRHSYSKARPLQLVAMQGETEATFKQWQPIRAQK